MRRPFAIAALLAFAATAFAQFPPIMLNDTPAVSTKPRETDAEALAAAKLNPTDGQELRAYLKLRTITEADRGRIAAVIARLGAEDFDKRLAAERDAEALGPAAVTALKAAADVEKLPVETADYEVAYRAGIVLNRMAKVPHARVARAAVEALARLPHPDNAKILFDFLPCADTFEVADAVRRALGQLAVQNGKTDAGVVAGLTHPFAGSRGAAALALVGELGRDTIRAPEALDPVRAAAAREADAAIKFDMQFLLAAVAKDPAMVGQLIGQLAELPRGRLWQVEDLLLELAGADAPQARFGKTAASSALAQKLWTTWWDGARDKLDFAAFQYRPRTTGRLLTVTNGSSAGRSGQVALRGSDLGELWSFSVPGGVYDTLIRPDGSVLTVEQGQNELRFRSTDGTLIDRQPFRTKAGTQHALPTQVATHTDGTTTVSCRNVVLAVGPPRPAGEPTAKILYERPQTYDIVTACRLADGRTVALLQSPPLWLIVIKPDGSTEEPIKAKSDRRVVTGYLSASGPNRILLTDPGRVVEYDLGTGQEVWSYTVNAPRFAQRLANGNTLVLAGDASQDRLLEVSPEGEPLWELKPPENETFMRAYRE